MLNAIIITVAVALGGYVAFSKRLAGSSNWKATVTPLATIMGSGFLVSASLLAGVVGNLALVCMGMLLVLAYMVGGAIRFNSRHFEPIENKGHGAVQNIALLSPMRSGLRGLYCQPFYRSGSRVYVRVDTTPDATERMARDGKRIRERIGSNEE